MKKLALVFVGVLLLGMVVPAMAETLHVGAGTGTKSFPLGNTFVYQKGQTPVYYTYSLHLNASDGGSYVFTGPMDGSTGIPMSTGPLEEDFNPFIGTYTIAEEAPEGFFWVNETVEIGADDFEEDPAAANCFSASGVFELQQIFTWPLKAVIMQMPVELWQKNSQIQNQRKSSHTPLAGATVWFDDGSGPVEVGSTDAEGRYVFTSQPGNNLYPGAGFYFMTEPGFFFWNPEYLVMSVMYLNEDLDESIFVAWSPTPPFLLSFTALSGENHVQIKWATLYENDLLGWCVHRSEQNNHLDAQNITPDMIPATNSSQMQFYSLTDTEIEPGGIYYYWLECVEAASSNFYGPVSVTVEGEVPGIYPSLSQLKNAWPNPFKSQTGTTIGVDIKEGETGSLTIYNVQGQALKTYELAAGSHELVWNGLDGNGKACGSGVYFYKLITPSLNQSKKMVIIK